VRVGIGETFFYAVTARNAGSTPCNWVNLTLKLPDEVDLVSAASSVPLTCAQDAVIRIVGLPFDVACRGGPGFFLMPGGTVTATFTVRALRPTSSVTATAVADPGNAWCCSPARCCKSTTDGFPCPNPGTTPAAPPAIHIGTADELAGSVVNLMQACTF
jgi:uncharacterized repeat protein (TIGR01451 family)